MNDIVQRLTDLANKHGFTDRSIIASSLAEILRLKEENAALKKQLSQDQK
jgi:hypothetical protein